MLVSQFQSLHPSPGKIIKKARNLKFLGLSLIIEAVFSRANSLNFVHRVMNQQLAKTRKDSVERNYQLTFQVIS